MKLLLVLAALAVASSGARHVRACARSSDCEVRGAACLDGECRISNQVTLFPGIAELESITLTQPAVFAVTNDHPTLQWDMPLGTTLLAAGIFRALPTYDAGKPGTIAHLDTSAVWLWLSSSDGNGAGVARFGDGAAPQNDPTTGIALGASVAALEPGIYYWAVWGWTGSELTHHSEVRSFAVGDEALTGARCSEPVTLANLQCVSRNGEGYYQVIACASGADCYENTACDLEVSNADVPGGVCRGACDCRAGCACSDDTVCDDSTGICAAVDDGNSALPNDGPASFGSGCAVAGGNSTGRAVDAAWFGIGALGAFCASSRRRRIPVWDRFARRP